jgi:hypothetical protein
MFGVPFGLGGSFGTWAFDYSILRAYLGGGEFLMAYFLLSICIFGASSV